MKYTFNIDWNSIINKLIGGGIVFMIVGLGGAIWDFQNIKAKVKSNENRLDVVSKIVCMYAMNDNLKAKHENTEYQASELCYEVFKGKKK